MALDSTIYRVQISDLRDDCCIDKLFQQLEDTTHGRQRVCFDLSNVTFVTPSGLVALVLAIQSVLNQVEYIELLNVDQTILSYLHRADFYKIFDDRLILSKPNSELLRKSASDKIVEITPIPFNGSEHKVACDEVMGRLKGVFQSWFPPGIDKDNGAQLCSTISELITNISHSQSLGYMTVQRYHKNTGQDEVCIAVGDTGRGIRQSLIANNPNDLSLNSLQNESDIIEKALDLRKNQNSRGVGLSSVVTRSSEWNGTLTIRSATARITHDKTERKSENDLIFIPGVQISISVRA